MSKDISYKYAKVQGPPKEPDDFWYPTTNLFIKILIFSYK